MNTRTLARLGAPTVALTLVALTAGPASAHVTATPSVANAGSYTVVTMSVGHGCDGSPTTSLDIQIPESVTSVTPTRNPYYEVEANIEQLDEPITDAHGNEVTERVSSITYTADTPLPEGQRDTFELSFQIPDTPGETLTFPTIQKCEQGSNDWVQVPEEGQDGEELESPAPSFVILDAAEEGDAHGAAEGASSDTTSDTTSETTEAASADSGSDTLGITGLVLGALGLLAGGTALARSRSNA